MVFLFLIVQLTFQNEELNNKIDLEIRILDGTLKLLNAICSANSSSLFQTTNLLNSTGPLGGYNALSGNSALSQSTNHSSLSSSVLINNLDLSNFDDTAKFNEAGAAIAAAIIHSSDSTLLFSNSTASFSSSSKNVASSDLNSIEYNHIFQILNACKCLFVSHRKIAIYLQNLQAIKEKGSHYASNNSDDMFNCQSGKAASLNSTMSTENGSITSASCSSSIDALLISSKLMSCNSVEGISIDTCKLMLSDIRIPLSWKYTEHLKATKSSGKNFCSIIRISRRKNCYFSYLLAQKM